MDIIKPGTNKMSLLLEKLKYISPLFLYGAGLCGERYLDILQANGINVEGFLDDDIKKQGNSIRGIKVKSPTSITDLIFRGGGGVLVSAYDQDRILARIKSTFPCLLEKIIPSDFYLFDNGFDYYDYYSCHKDKIECVYNSLSDEKSKLVMQNLLQYKITRQPHLIRSIRDPIETQYFDDKIINLSYKENFWDLGAYIGDTVNTFLRLVNNKFESIVALEPDDSNFTTLVSEMKHKIGNIICLPYGVGEADSCLRLKKYSSMTSFISEEGDTTIEIRSIDSLATNKHISFLKADIEGYEKQMLSGAIKTIIRCKPKLAISVYHRKDDIFAIPLMIKELVPEYKLFLRHYTNNAVDTVLYAV